MEICVESGPISSCQFRALQTHWLELQILSLQENGGVVGKNSALVGETYPFLSAAIGNKA